MVLKVTPVRNVYSGWPGHDPSDERDRLIRIIDDLIVSSDIPNTLRFVTSTGYVSLKKCVALQEYLRGETEDRLVRVRNLVDRLLKILTR